MKKIGIDASRAFQENPTGVEVYSTELLIHLKNLAESQSYEFVLYHRDKISSRIKTQFPFNFKFKKIGRKRFWTKFSLAKEMKINPPDLLFVPSHTFPPLLPKKRVITIHDVGWRYFPESYTKKQKSILEKSTKFAVKKADLIFADSIFTKNDLIRFFDAEPEKIKVSYLGFQTDLKPNSIKKIVEEEVLKRFTLKKEKYFLVLGRVESKKNFEYALKVFGKISAKYPEMQFVFAGKMGHGSDTFWEIAKQENVASKISATGYVDPITLTALLKNSLSLFHPSLFEGFGLPILEAFNSKVPVVCSRSSSLPEVAGPAALFIDPQNVDDGEDKLSNIIENKKLRKDLVKQGENQLKIFSWERTAKEVLEGIQTLL